MNESRGTCPNKWRPATESLVALSLLWVFGTTNLPGQEMRAGFALGAAVPAGDFRETRGTGPVAQLFVLFGGADRRIRLRVEAEGVRLPGHTPASSSTSTGGDLYILSGIGSLIMGPRSTPVRPYFLLGAGPQLVSVPKQVNPYGSVTGIRAGFGVEGRLRSWTIRGEIAGDAVLSDFGTGRDFGFGGYFPLTLAIQF